MSTYFYLECLSHDPPLVGGFEISQHDDDYVQTAIDYAAGKPAWTLGPWFWTQTRDQCDEWLARHEKCAIDVVNEYGDHRPIPGRTPDA